MLSKAPKCFPLDMEYIDALDTWKSDMKVGDSDWQYADQYAGYLWQWGCRWQVITMGGIIECTMGELQMGMYENEKLFYWNVFICKV